MAEESTFDIVKSMKRIEDYKCRLLQGIAALYEEMAREETAQSELLASLSEIMLSTYLLGEKLGISYKQLDNKAQQKIKAELLKEGSDKDMAAILALLSRHISSR